MTETAAQYGIEHGVPIARTPDYYQLSVQVEGDLFVGGRIAKLQTVRPGERLLDDTIENTAFFCEICGRIYARLFLDSALEWNCLDITPCQEHGDGSLQVYYGQRASEIMDAFPYEILVRELALLWEETETQEFLKQNGIN